MLTVTIVSFSYKAGVPVDSTEHGGGYVFDCRGIPNPGREGRFKKRTGLCADVIQFLDAGPEARAFKERSFGLVSAHLDVYLKRGFKHLFVAFGCTGGQHRSVYMAEALAKELSKSSQVSVKLIHRELDKHPEWERS